MANKDELDNKNLTLGLTPMLEVWNPHDPTYQEQEDYITGCTGVLKEHKKRNFIFWAIIKSIGVGYLKWVYDG